MISSVRFVALCVLFVAARNTTAQAFEAHKYGFGRYGTSDDVVAGDRGIKHSVQAVQFKYGSQGYPPYPFHYGGYQSHFYPNLHRGYSGYQPYHPTYPYYGGAYYGGYEGIVPHGGQGYGLNGPYKNFYPYIHGRGTQKAFY